jgi:multidrug efflux system membrane fusion protein
MRVRILLLVVGALALGGGTLYVWKHGGWSLASWAERGQAAPGDAKSTQVNTAPEAPRAKGAKSFEFAPSAAKPVPVVATTVRQGEVPIYLSGLGTVQAYYSVDVKSQVDGIIQRINFQEGQDVKAGDVLIILDPQQYEARLEEAQAKKARAVAQLENAKLNLTRNEELLKKDFATQKETDRTKMLVEQFTAEIAQYDADIKYAQTQLNFATIRSPINGRIGIRKVDPGNFIRVADNKTIVTIVQLQPISVIITLPAKSLQRTGVSIGQADLPVIAYAENGVTPLGRGTVQMVDNTVDPATGTIKVKASFANNQGRLWPGDFVDCRVIVEQRRDGLTIPTAAVRHGPRGDFVWLIEPDNTVKIRPVKVRQTLGGTSVIEVGLSADEKVVLDGYARLAPGSRVEIVPARTDDASRLSRVE